jgi:hypothetical protein
MSMHPFTPRTARILWVTFIAILVLSVLAELRVHRHPIFGIDRIFGFYAWYGFASCIALVGLAKLIGWVLKRRDTYYDR